MAEHRRGEAETKQQGDNRPVGVAPVVRSSRFKYYIHDGVDCLRLQLIGELCEAEIHDLTGCWQTARCTLSNRKLILDLRSLRTCDEAGHEWLLSMVREGATTMPDSYFRDRLVTGSQPPPEERNTPNGKLSRAAGFFRASRSLEVDNPKIT